MFDNPYAAPERPGPPARRGWPSWLIAAIGIVTGLVLLAVPVGAFLADQPSGSSSASAAPDIGDPAPEPSSSDSGGDGGSGGSGGGAGAAGGEQLQIDFPDGATGSFRIPLGMEHDSANDDDGHVSVKAASSDGPYIDVYTDETAASHRSDLHAAVEGERTYNRDDKGQVSAIRYRTIGGHPAGQFTVRYHGKYKDQVYDNLVTVILVGDQVLSVYWSDNTDFFVSANAQRDEAAVIQSFRVDDSGGSSGSSPSGSSDSSGGSTV